MEIGNISSLYFEELRFTASSPGIGKNALEGGLKGPGYSGGTSGLPSFAELLEKSYGKTGPDKDAALPPEPESPGRATSPDKSPPALPPDKPVIDKTGKLYEQCEALETFLVKTLITGMRNTVQKSGFIRAEGV
jgi:flagellar protein FlgJ